MKFIAALILLSSSAFAQFESAVTSRLRITPLTVNAGNLLPTPNYEPDPLAVTVGVVSLQRPATFVGTAHMDFGYFIQNRWEQWVDSYQAYTITTFNFGTNEKQFCTQVCGQVAWGTAVYAFPPFQGTFLECPDEPLEHCHFQPNEDWHYLRVANDIPFSVPLWPGTFPITAVAQGGVSFWNGEWQCCATHAYKIDYNLHSLVLAGHLIQ